MMPAQSLANHFSRLESASVASVKSPRALAKQAIHAGASGWVGDVSKALSLISMRANFGAETRRTPITFCPEQPGVGRKRNGRNGRNGFLHCPCSLRGHWRATWKESGRSPELAFQVSRVEACCAGNVGSGFHASSSLQIRSS